MSAVPAMLLLGQTQARTSLAVSIAGLIIASLLLFGIFIWLRKRMLGDASDEAGDTLSIQQVRQLHREKKITDEEFEALRRAALLAAGVPPDKVRSDALQAPTPPGPGPESRLESARAKSQHAEAPERTPDGGLRARPGYDLTGEPLPGYGDQSPPPPPSNR